MRSISISYSWLVLCVAIACRTSKQVAGFRRRDRTVRCCFKRGNCRGRQHACLCMDPCESGFRASCRCDSDPCDHMATNALATCRHADHALCCLLHLLSFMRWVAASESGGETLDATHNAAHPTMEMFMSSAATNACVSPVAIAAVKTVLEAHARAETDRMLALVPSIVCGRENL